MYNNKNIYKPKMPLQERLQYAKDWIDRIDEDKESDIEYCLRASLNQIIQYLKEVDNNGR